MLRYWLTHFHPAEKIFHPQLWVAYSPCGSQHKDAVQITLEQIDLIKRLMADYNKHLQLATTANGETFISTFPKFFETQIWWPSTNRARSPG